MLFFCTFISILLWLPKKECAFTGTQNLVEAHVHQDGKEENSNKNEVMSDQTLKKGSDFYKSCCPFFLACTLVMVHL
jgi:hypothetical protein